jgi:hypothetical protein
MSKEEAATCKQRPCGSDGFSDHTQLPGQASHKCCDIVAKLPVGWCRESMLLLMLAGVT